MNVKKKDVVSKYDIKTIYKDHYQKPLLKITPADVGLTQEMDWGEDVGAEVLDAEA